MVKNVNGQILRDGVVVRKRWAEYFEQVLNVVVVVGQTVGSISSKMLACDCLYTLEMFTASLIATS